MNESSIFAILDTHHIIQGTGFLVADKLGVTCAHVVRSCGKGPGDELEIYFLDMGETNMVRVLPEHWHEDQDVAFLSLTQDTSIKKSPLHLRPANKSMDASVKSYGFPATPTQGLYAKGAVLGLVKDGNERELVQLNSTEITKGFSGAPIWDTQTFQVVGMVTAVLKADKLGRLDQTAFASPSETLVKLYPFLALHDPAGDLVKGITRLPFGYDTRIKNFITDYLEAPFGGREADVAALDTWLTTPDAPPYALLAAEAGRGKTALLVQWIQTVQARNLAEIAFVPVSLRYNTAQATTVFTSLAVRLGAVYQEHTPYAQLSAEEWKEVCANYLERTPPEGKPVLVILDGLDEATDWQAGPDLFPVHPPEGVRVLVSARHQAGDVNAKGWLSRLGWEKAGRAQAFPLEYLTENGLRDVLEKMGNPLDKLTTQVDVIQELFRLSEGDPLLVRLYVESLMPYGDQAAELKPEDLVKINIGLKGFFDRWWQDQKRQWGRVNPLKTQYISTTLNLLACALAPLSKNDILELAPPNSDLNTWTLEDAFNVLQRFVIGDGERQGYAFTHPRLGYYFYERLTIVEQKKWEQYFLDYGKRTLKTLTQKLNDSMDLSPYPLQTYGAHLVRGKKQAQEFFNLVSLGWLQGWYKLEGTYSGFLTDVDRVWKKADPRKEVGIQIKCVLCHSSVQTLSANLEAKVLARAVEHHLLSPLQALVIIEKNSGEELKARQLIVMARLFPKLLLKSVLEIIQTIQDAYFRAKALDGVAPYLPVELLPAALQIALAIQDEMWQAEAIIGLVPYLPLELRLSSLQTVLKVVQFTLINIREDHCAAILTTIAPHLHPDSLLTALQIVQTFHKTRYWEEALAGLAPYVPIELLSTALQTKITILDEKECVHALTGLIPYLPIELLPFVIQTFRNIQNERDRIRALTRLIPYLPDELLSPVLLTTWQAIQRIGFAEALSELAPHMAPEMFSAALQITLTIQDKISRAFVLTRLLPYMPVELYSTTLRAALQAAKAIEFEGGYVLAHARLVPYLPQELIPKVMQAALHTAKVIQDERQRSEALTTLAPHLPTQLLPNALQVALTIQNEYLRVEALMGLTPYLPSEMHHLVLQTIQAIQDEKNLAKTLNSLVPLISTELCLTALQTAQTIQDFEWRAFALAGVASQLPLEFLPKVLQEAQTIQDDEGWAEILTGLAPYLPVEMLRKVLQAAQAIVNEKARKIALIGLAPYLPKDLRLTVLQTVYIFQDARWRVEVLAGLAPNLPSELLPVVLLDALQDLQVIRDESSRTSALVMLSPYLPRNLYSKALQIIRAIQEEYFREYALIEFVPYLPMELLPEAVQVAKTIWDEKYRAKVFARLAHYLPEEMRLSTLQSSIQVAETIQDAEFRVNILTSVLHQLPDELRHTIIETALSGTRAIRDSWAEISAIVLLVPYLTVEQQQTYLQTALQVAQNIRDERNHSSALNLLAPHLSIEMLKVALQAAISIRDEMYRAFTLADLAPYLSEGLILTAFQAALAVENERWSADALVGLAPYLPSELILTTLNAAQSFQDEYPRASVLTGLVPYLPERFHPIILPVTLNAALAIHNEHSRAEILTKLLPQLSKELIPIALQAALDFQDGYFREHVLTRLLPYLPVEFHPTVMQEALQATLTIQDKKQRASVLTELVPLLVDWVNKNSDEGFGNWINSLYTLGKYSRSNVLEDLSKLLPLILELSPNSKEETATDIFHAIQEVCEWWP